MHTLSSVESAQCENNQRFVPSIGNIHIVLSNLFEYIWTQKVHSKAKIDSFSSLFYANWFFLGGP